MVKRLKIIHAIVLFILTALFIPSMALKIKNQVDRVIGDSSLFGDSIRSYEQLDSAFAILYFVATIEILVWSILAFLQAKKANESGRTQLLLLTLIALPLLLRSTYIMGDTIYEELLSRYGNKRLYLATAIIYNLTTLTIYAGIVAIARHFATSTPLPHAPGQMNLSYNPNNNNPNLWSAPGLPPHDPNKPNMSVVHEGAPPPPLYHHQANFQQQQQPTPYHQPHGTAQYTAPPFHPHPHPHSQQQQQQMPYQLQQPYPNPPQHYQHQHQYPNQSYPSYHQQQQQQHSHSPPPQQQMQRYPAPPPSE
ncbi:MAG: hypothetical protein Q9224_007662, partial [Gallowayella concinna]